MKYIIACIYFKMETTERVWQCSTKHYQQFPIQGSMSTYPLESVCQRYVLFFVWISSHVKASLSIRVLLVSVKSWLLLHLRTNWIYSLDNIFSWTINNLCHSTTPDYELNKYIIRFILLKTRKLSLTRLSIYYHYSKYKWWHKYSNI